MSKQAELDLLLGSPAVAAVGDPLDRYYTFPHVAEAFVRCLPWDDLEGNIIEPSVGAGAWLVPLDARYPRARLIAVDLDPRAAGLRSPLLDKTITGDFVVEAHSPRSGRPLPRRPENCTVIGNPPFSTLDAFLEAAFLLANRVAFLVQDNALTAELRETLVLSRPLRAVLASSIRLRWVGRKGQSSFTYSVFCWDAAWRGPCTYHRVDTTPQGRGDLLARHQQVTA